MTLYGSALFLHVLAAIGLVGTTLAAHVLLGLARRARLGDAIRPLLSLAHACGKAANPLALVVVAAGLYMAFAGQWWGAGWPVVSLVLFALAGATAGIVVDPWVARLDASAAAAEIGAPVPPDVVAELTSPRGTMALWVISGLDAAIVALMTNKPGYTGSLVVAIVAVSLAVALGLRQLRRHGAPAATATAP